MAPKLTFKQQLDSFPNAFWVANTMELIERLAYFGVRAVVGLFIVDAAVKGGLELTHLQRGTIFMVWALFQTLLPMFTGAYSDRYGYKISLYLAFTLITIAYILMGLSHTYTTFFASALLLATGTAIFKPPLHGTLAHTVKDENSSVGWGMFYMLVNIGGFLGPFIAGMMRVIAWKYVFFASAVIVALNFIPTMFFLKDYSVEVRKSKGDAPQAGPIGTFVNGILTLIKDVRFVVFLLIFSGFWLMFMQLFDTLPIYIDEWVNTSGEASWVVKNIPMSAVNLVGWVLTILAAVLTIWAVVQKKKVLAYMLGLAALVAFTLKLGLGQVIESAVGEQVIKPEFMVNIDAGAIVFLMLGVAVITGKMKPIVAMIVGMLISTIAILACGIFISGWMVAVAIFVFAVGEMACSPKFSEYIGLMAPPEKKAIYMGYSNIPFAIGWTFAGMLSGIFYAQYSDKFDFGRQYLAQELGAKSVYVQYAEVKEATNEILALALNSADTTNFVLATPLDSSHRIADQHAELWLDANVKFAQVKFKSGEMDTIVVGKAERSEDTRVGRHEVHLPDGAKLGNAWVSHFDTVYVALARTLDAKQEPQEIATGEVASETDTLLKSDPQGLRTQDIPIRIWVEKVDVLKDREKDKQFVKEGKALVKAGKVEEGMKLMKRETGLRKIAVMPVLQDRLNKTPNEITQMLWDRYHPWRMWVIFAVIGAVATLAMVCYHFWLEADKKKREAQQA